jgi:hypothetical protein
MKTISLKIFLNISVIIAFLSFTSCSPFKEILPGYKLYDAPNSIDKPGKIYRLSGDGKTDYVVEFLELKLNPQTIIIKDQEQEKKTSINSIIPFISKGKAINVSTNLNMEKETTFRFRLAQTQVLKVTDENLRPIYSNLLSRLNEDIKLFGYKNQRYFIVREAVTAKEIFIRIDKLSKGNNSLTAEINKIIETNSKAVWTNQKRMK